MGLPIIYAVKKTRNWRHARAAPTLPNYSNYLRYEEACGKRSACLDAIETARRSAETQRQTARVLEASKELPKWETLDGKSFERELVKLFRERGYEVKWAGRTGGDEGIDILLKVNGRKIIVRCKAHRHYISPGPVRDLYGALIHQKADEAWLITTSGFYGGAISFARGKPIRLLTIWDVLVGCELQDLPAGGPHGSQRLAC